MANIQVNLCGRTLKGPFILFQGGPGALTSDHLAEPV
jgi:hypothetical protein